MPRNNNYKSSQIQNEREMVPARERRLRERRRLEALHAIEDPIQMDKDKANDTPQADTRGNTVPNSLTARALRPIHTESNKHQNSSKMRMRRFRERRRLESLSAVAMPPIASTSIEASMGVINSNYEDPIEMDKNKANDTAQADTRSKIDHNCLGNFDSSLHHSITIKNEEDIPEQNSSFYHVLQPQFVESATAPIPEISNLPEAMSYIKALNDYVLLQENFRAVGLLTQVEEVMQNPPNSQDFEEP